VSQWNIQSDRLVYSCDYESESKTSESESINDDL
jgi:hypothetical protein